MKQYFIIRTLRNKAKNALQQEIHDLFDSFNQKLISAEDLTPWIKELSNKIVMLNRKHHRSKPEELRTWNAEKQNLGCAPCDSYQIMIYEVRDTIEKKD